MTTLPTTYGDITYSDKTRRLLDRALKAVREELPTFGQQFKNPADVTALCKLRLMGLQSEKFLVLFLNTQNQLIADEVLAEGTVDAATIHTREVVKRALYHNASAVIFSHNHPSGSGIVSEPDKTITKRLATALKLVGVDVLDHILIAGDDAVSFASNPELNYSLMPTMI